MLMPLQAHSTEHWLVMGDSLSAAYGIPNESGWVALLAKRYQEQAIRLINASLSGETTSGGLQRLPALLELHRPQRVILELGANDALRGQNLRKMQRNLRKMIKLSLAQGAEVVLLGIRLPSNYGPIYDRLLRNSYATLAKEFALRFDPFFLQDVALEPDLMQQDGLHPNEKAQPIIMERVWRLLQSEIK